MTSKGTQLFKRVFFLLLGIALLYAPLALLPRFLGWLTGSHLIPDAHRICLRMPYEWLLQPWMYPTMLGEPMYLVAPLFLPLFALLVGPWFCGWLCPAGVFPELLSRLVPSRLQINLQGRLNPAPIRYGVFAGMLISPFLGSYICCTYCNFTAMQNLVSAAFGDFVGLSAWATFTILTFVLWLFVLGLFFRGGRGWCVLLCPAGAAMGLAHAAGKRLRPSSALQIDSDRCQSCEQCVESCPALAIQGGHINSHLCNLCLECRGACPSGAIRWMPGGNSPQRSA